MQRFQDIYTKLELICRAYQFHVLIPLNFIIPIIVVNHSIQYPYRYITEDPVMLFLVSIGSVFYFLLCAHLGEEISNEGFKAIIWASFFNYAAFVVLAIWYYVTYNSTRRINERESRERMRQELVVN